MHKKDQPHARSAHGNAGTACVGVATDLFALINLSSNSMLHPPHLVDQSTTLVCTHGGLPNQLNGLANASIHPSTFHFRFQKTPPHPVHARVDPSQVHGAVLVSLITLAWLT